MVFEKFQEAMEIYPMIFSNDRQIEFMYFEKRQKMPNRDTLCNC